MLITFHSLHEFSIRIPSRVCRLRRDLVEAKRAINFFSVVEATRRHLFRHIITASTNKSCSFLRDRLAFLAALEHRVEQQKSFHQYYQVAIKNGLTLR